MKNPKKPQGVGGILDNDSDEDDEDEQVPVSNSRHVSIAS
jgi:hypothetical protein